MSEKTVAEVVAALPAKGVVRLYNTSPNKPFVHRYDSRWIIFNPANNVAYEKNREKITGQGKSGRRVLWKYGVKATNKKGKNWAEVPVEEARKILQGDAAVLEPKPGEEIFHHGGTIKTLDQVDEAISFEHDQKSAQLAAMKAELAEIEKKIAEKSAINERIMQVTGGPQASTPPSTPPPSPPPAAAGTPPGSGKPKKPSDGDKTS